MLAHNHLVVDIESRYVLQSSQTGAPCTIGSPIDALLLCKESTDTVLHDWYMSGSGKFTTCYSCTFVLAPSIDLLPHT